MWRSTIKTRRGSDPGLLHPLCQGPETLPSNPGLQGFYENFDCVDHNKLWKILKDMGIPDHLTCLLRNLYAGQEATVRTGHGTTD